MGLPVNAIERALAEKAPDVFGRTICRPTADSQGWAQAARPRPVNSSIVDRARSYIEKMEPAIEGAGGDDHTYRVACRLRDFGLDEVDALAVFSDWNTRCVPPWSIEELADKYRNAVKYATGQAGNLVQDERWSPHRSSPITPAEPSLPVTGSEAEPAATFPASWRLLDDVQVLELPDPEYLIDGMIPRRGVGAIYSLSGTGKTTLLASLLVAVATEKPFLGHRVCHRGASVYVATEDPAGFKVRLRAAKQAAGLALDQAVGVFTFPEPIDLRDPVSVTRFSRFLTAAMAGRPLEVIVVDTYAAATPGASENSSEDTTMAMVHAQRWRDTTGATVILAHHTNAGGTRERGHSAMRGACDFMISMTAVDDVIHLESSKQRNAAPFERLTLKLSPVDGGGCVLRLADDVLPAAGLTAAQTQAYNVLRDTFAANGATKGEWQRTCLGVSERTFHRACKVLGERGYVQEVGSYFRVTGKAVL